MTRLKLFTLICAAGLLVFQACTSKKEIPQPVVDTQRVDQLRQELRDLQIKVLGNATTYSRDSLTYDQLVLQVNALLAQYAKHVTYSVIAGDYQGNSLAGVTVKVSQAGAVISQTTSASGVATFTGLNGGIISATAELAGFARLVFRADIRNYNTDQAYSAASTVLMLPLGGTPASDAGMITVNINLYANFTTVNDTLGGPADWPGQSDITKALPEGPNVNNPKVSYSSITDKPIMAFINAFSFLNGGAPSGFTYDLINSNSTFGNEYAPGSVLSVAYENAVYTAAAAGANGVYTLKLPASSFYDNNHFRFDLVFAEFSNSFTDYVPGGAGVKIKPPFDPTYTSTQIFRVVSPSQLKSAQAGNLSTQKYFYTNSLN
jgi:hypothetical protein